MALVYKSLSEVPALPRPARTFDELQPDWDFSYVEQQQRRHAGGRMEDRTPGEQERKAKQLAARKAARAERGKLRTQFTDAVVELLKSGKISACDVARKLKRPSKTIYAIMRRLVKAGLVERLEVVGGARNNKYLFRLTKRPS